MDDDKINKYIRKLMSVSMRDIAKIIEDDVSLTDEEIDKIIFSLLIAKSPSVPKTLN